MPISNPRYHLPRIDYDCPVKLIVLVNPNTNMAITGRMVAIARKHLEPGFSLEATTAASGAQLIVNEDQLRVAAQAIAPALAATSDGVIVSAFGDPGVDELRKQLTQPVVGIAESAMREAGRGERFAQFLPARSVGIPAEFRNARAIVIAALGRHLN